MLCSAAQEACSSKRIPVFQDCISYLIKSKGQRAAFCVHGLFDLQVSDRKVQLLRQAFQSGRNPLRMLTLQDPRLVSSSGLLHHTGSRALSPNCVSALCQPLCLLQVAGLLKVWLEELCEPLVRTDLYEQVLRTQYHHLQLRRLTALQAVLTQVCQPYCKATVLSDKHCPV